MKPLAIMIVAGEPSGDTLAAELVESLRRELTARATVYTPDQQPLQTGLEPRFFGAGGQKMNAAGVELAFDLTKHSIIGVPTFSKYLKLRNLFNQLYQLALEREPDAIVCVDFGEFNRRFAHAIKQYTRSRKDWFHDWQPKLIQYVSPQVWASREWRANQIARDYDLLLSIFPFEKEWYASRVPHLHVEFVGYPLLDRYANNGAPISTQEAQASTNGARILLLPGSRTGELKRHVPVMLAAFEKIRNAVSGARAVMVLPNEPLAARARSIGLPKDLDLRVSGLPEALAQSDLAIAKTGTISMECALFGVPTVTLYKTSWAEFQIAKRLAKVESATMPNLLAKEEIFPEFIQDKATPGNIADAAIALLRDDARRTRLKAKLAGIIAGLGGPGANQRAARAIADLCEGEGGKIRNPS